MLKDRNPFIIQIKGGDINDRSLPGFSDRRYEGSGIPAKEVTSLRRVIEPRISRLALWIVFILCSLLYARVLFLQIIQGSEYRSVAEGNRIRLEVLPAPRGIIVDRNNKDLVKNIPQSMAVMIPADWPLVEADRQKQWQSLQKIFPELDQQQLESNLNWRSYQPLIIKENISHDQALILSNQQQGLVGVNVITSTRRQYVLDDATSHILGYLGPLTPEEYKSKKTFYTLTDYIGRMGLESFYENNLRGVPGKREIEVDNLGRPRKVFAELPATKGSQLVLTIDADLQAVAVKALADEVKAIGQKSGAVVALNPKNGEVLALASLPLFSPEAFQPENSEQAVKILQDNSRPLFNRVISGVYPSGSTIKPVIAAGALADGNVKPTTTFMSTGGLWAGNRFFADWKAGGHGLTNIYKAIAESVNTYFYTIGGGTAEHSGLGVDKIDYYLKKFNFGKVAGIDLSGEAAGLVPDEQWKKDNLGERWYLGDTYNLSIGQGNFLTTPLQLAVAYSAIINKGLLLKPYLVKAITTADNKTTLVKPEIISTVPVSEDNLVVIKEAMRQTVLAGSARLLQTVPIALGGKTGTAQTGGGKSTHAWFVGFGPYDDPSLVVVILIEDGGDSARVAVPVAKQIFDWYAANRL